MKRRQFLTGGGLAAPVLAAAPAKPAGIGKLRITRVHTVEVRGVPTGKGLVLPWDPKKIPQDTRDYVITQFFTDQGLTGTTMDGDYQLPRGAGAEVQQRAEAHRKLKLAPTVRETLDELHAAGRGAQLHSFIAYAPLSA